MPNPRGSLFVSAGPKELKDHRVDISDEIVYIGYDNDGRLAVAAQVDDVLCKIISRSDASAGHNFVASDPQGHCCFTVNDVPIVQEVRILDGDVLKCAKSGLVAKVIIVANGGTGAPQPSDEPGSRTHGYSTSSNEKSTS